jgi:hypothetical protein
VYALDPSAAQYSKADALLLLLPPLLLIIYQIKP